jgi:hypothetical protein
VNRHVKIQLEILSKSKATLSVYIGKTKLNPKSNR